VPLSTQNMQVGTSMPATVHAASMCKMSTPSVGSTATTTPGCNRVEITKQTEAPEAGNRPVVPASERSPLRSAATPYTPPAEEDKEDETASDTASRTTIMLCNLPRHYSRSLVVDLLQSAGFLDHIRFIYVPMNLRSSGNFGYAFVDFDSVSVTEQCRAHMVGFNIWDQESDRAIEIEWSVTQGLDANVQRYRDSPLMHDSVDDELKPALFESGVRVPFPAPTKNIRPPRLRRSVDQNKQSRPRADTV
jgi:hypothetical protein